MEGIPQEVRLSHNSSRCEIYPQPKEQARATNNRVAACTGTVAPILVKGRRRLAVPFTGEALGHAIFTRRAWAQ